MFWHITITVSLHRRKIFGKTLYSNPGFCSDVSDGSYHVNKHVYNVIGCTRAYRLIDTSGHSMHVDVFHYLYTVVTALHLERESCPSNADMTDFVTASCRNACGTLCIVSYTKRHDYEVAFPSADLETIFSSP
nr:hypothetical protein CFP56_01136 [Quercus suber]